MSDRGGGPADAAGGPVAHVPVLLADICATLRVAEGGVFVDGTFGAGGYSRAILQANPANVVLAIDRDPGAAAAAQRLASCEGGRFQFVQGRFGALDRIAAGAGHERVDGVVLDVGVSSMQLDEAMRGFSFRRDGPLDMRMEQEGPSAADLVNEASEAELADIIYHYGEERRARAVARAIVERRRRGRIGTTGELAELIARHVRGEPGLDPATRTFQGLRIAVNDELVELVDALHAAEACLRPGGRLTIVSFHSLEDRLVKQFLTERASRAVRASRHLPAAPPAIPTFTLVTRGPIVAGEGETRANPRARSAKLRAAERSEAAPGPRLSKVAALAELPQRAKRESAR